MLFLFFFLIFLPRERKISLWFYVQCIYKLNSSNLKLEFVWNISLFRIIKVTLVFFYKQKFFGKHYEINFVCNVIPWCICLSELGLVFLNWSRNHCWQKVHLLVDAFLKLHEILECPRGENLRKKKKNSPHHQKQKSRNSPLCNFCCLRAFFYFHIWNKKKNLHFIAVSSLLSFYLFVKSSKSFDRLAILVEPSVTNG